MDTCSIIANCMTNFKNFIGKIGIIILIETSGIVFSSRPMCKLLILSVSISFFQGITLTRSILGTLTALISVKGKQSKYGDFHEILEEVVTWRICMPFLFWSSRISLKNIYRKRFWLICPRRIHCKMTTQSMPKALKNYSTKVKIKYVQTEMKV